MKYFITILSITLSYLSAIGQTGNNVVTNGGELFYFENDSLKIREGPELWTFVTYVESSYDGNILFYKGDHTYGPDYQKVTTVRDTPRYDNCGFRLNDSTYLNFYVKRDISEGVGQGRLIVKKIYLRNTSVAVDNEESILQIDSILGIAISSDTVGGNWVVVRTGLNRITSYYFHSSPIYKKKVESAIPVIWPNGTLRYEKAIRASPSGNKLMLQTEIYERDNFDNVLTYYSNVSVASFDKQTGLVSDLKTVFDTLDASNDYRPPIGEFSSNDAYLYIISSIRNPSGSRNSHLYKCNLATRQNKYVGTTLGSETYRSDKITFPISIKYFNDGKIYLVRGTSGAPYGKKAYMLDAISAPNNMEENYQTKSFVSNPIHSYSDRRLGYSKYNYIRTKPQYTYDCAGHVTFSDNCDYALPNTKVNYFSEDIAGSGVLVARGENPTINYTQNGDYLCKVVLKSHEGTYKEIHYDTLKIRIPEKPVAVFTAADTVICAYVPLEFTTQSTTDTIHTANGEKWVWTFGDGETQTVLLPFGEDRGGDTSVSHVYTTPGTYTVSLFYSNGFCDSTLTRNQYITVVDAPAPGFSIDNNRGCTPFTVTVTDTVTKNTTKKEYLVSGQLAFMDSLPFSGSWDEYYSLPFGEGRGGAFTFSQAGTYWITQRLYGYTGCITQLDSQQVFVTSGFTELDTSHITNATYQDVPAHPKVDEVITINWPCLLEDASVRYDLYRNNQKIAELDSQPCVYGQMWYADSLEQASGSIMKYNVLAIDSCGTATQVGRVGQPVYISGEVVGNNEFSIISYTVYQDWNVGESELSYELQTEDLLGGWMTINEQNSTALYSDYQFLGGAVTQSGVEGSTSLSMTSLEKCYRVVAKAGPSKSSISTIVCLPYTPVVFIPTAFSPNGDNLNDVYRPVTFGIEHYEVDIYNRYGQKVKHFTEQDAGWTATNASTGAYMVIIRAKGTDNLWYNLKSTVTVVR